MVVGIMLIDLTSIESELRCVHDHDHHEHEHNRDHHEHVHNRDHHDNHDHHDHRDHQRGGRQWRGGWYAGGDDELCMIG